MLWNETIHLKETMPVSIASTNTDNKAENFRVMPCDCKDARLAAGSASAADRAGEGGEDPPKSVIRSFTPPEARELCLCEIH